MHNREYTVFLRPHEGGMMLHTMYYAEEVREVEGFGAPDVELKESEVKVAHQLIEALASEWDPEKYHDTFQENLKNLIQTKLEGGKIAEVEKPKKLAPVVDLMSALKESLAQMEGRKSRLRRLLRLLLSPKNVLAHAASTCERIHFSSQIRARYNLFTSVSVTNLLRDLPFCQLALSLFRS